jgi:hypothetical protein
MFGWIARYVNIAKVFDVAEWRSERSISRHGQRGRRLAASLVAAALPLACAAPRPAPSPLANPLLGTWATADHARITLRPDTVLQNPPQGPPQAFGTQTCDGVFRFRYTIKSRAALTALISRQPGLRDRLSRLLPRPRYRVAELACGRGDQTYVLLNDRQLVAIYRDGDIGGIEHLSRRGS